MMKKLLLILAVVSISAVGLSFGGRGDVWIETTQGDFADGEAVGGLGVNLYASAPGDVRMVGNNWDLNQDSYKDIVFSNSQNGGTYNICSYIYWGSASGYSPANLDSLPTHGAMGSTIADLDGDGYLDLVFSNIHNGSTYNIHSYVYWGSASGYSPANLDSLPTHGAIGNSAADLNRDGYLDLVFANFYDGVTRNIYSYIYWGSASGYSPANLDSLPTHGAAGNSIVDLDGDGYLDLIFSNQRNGATYNICSYIYWGSDSGYSPTNLDSLPTHGACGSSIADLNGDGYLDIVFSNYHNDVTRNIYSYIYWGSASGYSPANLESLPTHGAVGSSVADLDGDGYLDIVFSNHHDDVAHNICSCIYWGSASGYSPTDVDSLPTRGAYGNSIADLNGDGYLDLVFSNQYDDLSFNIHSYIYWGSASGYSPTNLDSLPTHGACLGIEKDLGNVHARDSVEVYLSSVFDVGQEALWDTINWIATVPSGSSLSMEVRTGDTLEPDSTWSGWVGVAQGANIPDTLDSRYIQYRALIGTNYKVTPILEEVSIAHLTLPQVTVVTPNGGETWVVDNEDTIRWVAYDVSGIDSISIFYSTDGGTSWDTVSTGESNDSSYAWTVPSTPSESCLVRIGAYDPGLLYGEDASDSLFTISSDQIPPQVTVAVPNGGENWAIGEEDTIRWIASDNVSVDHLDIFYSTDGGTGWDTVSTGEPNDSSYAWTIPSTPSESCLVRIVAYDPGLLYGEDVSDSLFTISDQIPPQVTVVVPNGGELWPIGETVTIEWIATDNIGVDSVNIYYSTDSGSSWDTVSIGEPNDSSYDWEVPGPPSAFCLARIEAFDAVPSMGFDESDSLFTIYEVGVEELMAGGLPLPKAHSLSQNRPNPCGEFTIVNYQLPKLSHTTLRIYDITGRLVRILVDKEQEVGYYTVRWDGRGEDGQVVPSGVYFYQLKARQTDGPSRTRRAGEQVRHTHGGQARHTHGGQAGELVRTKKLTLLR